MAVGLGGRGKERVRVLRVGEEVVEAEREGKRGGAKRRRWGV